MPTNALVLNADDAGLGAQDVLKPADLLEHAAHARLAGGVRDIAEVHRLMLALPRCTTLRTLTPCLANTPAIAARTPERSATEKRM